MANPARPPRWYLPALLAIAGTAAGAYVWRAGNYLEIYYGAAVRSMASSWHDFYFGAFDPAGTISVDKLPGALWLQALMVRSFGLHPLVLVLPQAVEGAVTVLVVGRIVRRLVAPITSPTGAAWSAVGAAALLLASPAAAALDRGNIPDSLMILLLALAANSTVSAITTGHVRHLVLVGAYVGLAFEVKMLEAWLVLPALGGTYLLAGPNRLRAPRSR